MKLKAAFVTLASLLTVVVGSLCGCAEGDNSDLGQPVSAIVLRNRYEDPYVALQVLCTDGEYCPSPAQPLKGTLIDLVDLIPEARDIVRKTASPRSFILSDLPNSFGIAGEKVYVRRTWTLHSDSSDPLSITNPGILQADVKLQKVRSDSGDVDYNLVINFDFTRASRWEAILKSATDSPLRKRFQDLFNYSQKTVSDDRRNAVIKVSALRDFTTPTNLNQIEGWPLAEFNDLVKAIYVDLKTDSFFATDTFPMRTENYKLKHRR